MVFTNYGWHVGEAHFMGNLVKKALKRGIIYSIPTEVGLQATHVTHKATASKCTRYFEVVLFLWTRHLLSGCGAWVVGAI